MGTPLSVIVANLYMKFFEQLELESALTRPRFWRQYVDNACCVVKKATVDELMDHLNNVWPPSSL